MKDTYQDIWDDLKKPEPKTYEFRPGNEPVRNNHNDEESIEAWKLCRERHADNKAEMAGFQIMMILKVFGLTIGAMLVVIGIVTFFFPLILAGGLMCYAICKS